jgi:hypothetical protein
MKVASHLHYDLAPVCFIAKAKVFLRGSQNFLSRLIHAKMRCCDELCCGGRKYFCLKTWIKRLQLLDAYSLKTVFNLRQQTTYFEADPLKGA